MIFIIIFIIAALYLAWALLSYLNEHHRVWVDWTLIPMALTTLFFVGPPAVLIGLALLIKNVLA